MTDLCLSTFAGRTCARPVGHASDHSSGLGWGSVTWPQKGAQARRDGIAAQRRQCEHGCLEQPVEDAS